MAIVNYARDVKPFDDGSVMFTDDFIARELNGQTLAEIGTADSRKFHADADWWFLADQNVYEGEFQALRDDPGTPVGVKDTLKRIWQIIFGVGQPSMNTGIRYSTSGEPLERQFAGDLKQFFEWCVANNPDITQVAVDEFYLIGNGLKYPAGDVTAADVATARNEYNADNDLNENKNQLNAEYNRLYNIYVAPILQSNDPAEVTDQAMKDALLAMSVNWVDQLGA